jgi:catechol 2,3-dioxygenase-like lactoylglutathione lyase family enzyme
MPGTEAVAHSHTGICTSDLERSHRFYVEALGFSIRNQYDVGAEYAALAELPDLRMRSVFLVLGGCVLELLGYDRPRAVGRRHRRPMNRLGLTHLSFVVADIDAVAERIAACGGRVLHQTRTDSADSTVMYCTDPDGVRIELMETRT